MKGFDADVVIVGGGLVGASLALALARAGRRVTLLEGQVPDFSRITEGWDARIYAVSPANRRFLEGLGAWPDASRLGTIARMEVHGDAGGEIDFDAREAGGKALAWIAENRWLLAALWASLAEAGVDVLSGAKPVSLATRADAAELTLSDGRRLVARLAVGADGANSWVREQAGLTARVDAYGQSGVVANFACEKPHGDVARQWFTGDSILAWLPMAGKHVSMVWSTFEPDALLAQGDDAFCAKVAEAGGFELGQLSLVSRPAAFPLRLIRPEAVVAERVALVGDAAHTVHPLAGQGVNLGFQDAATLAGLIASARDAGDWLLLRRYQRARREAVTAMQLTCDGLFKLFHGKGLPGLPWLRNTGLNLTNRLTPLKRELVRHAIGF
ncbi:UbiH/UbiF family hydroxylase [Crenobacter luteus]|uniref:Ubiquinone biosynthesis protein UbiH n=1 Tax=Crenobacter luteus TaxID=1452487 RepID=A0A165FQC4_9NEIS|nr:UbiH/UbiF family hydroxylase [Crenobacter luteus]KZE33885.1 ubiquinone biosynthesis protein UbiH [Crenobacter luteus]